MYNDGAFAFSIPEALTHVPVGRSTLYREIKSGRLAIVKCGRRTLITPKALQAWLDLLAADDEQEASVP